MFILGILAVIQVTFLPGILILKWFNIRKDVIQTLIYAFALSLIANHLYVVMLTHLGINHSFMHYLLFGIEVILALVLYWKELSRPIGEVIQPWIRKIIQEMETFFQSFRLAEKERFTIQTLTWGVGSVFVFWSLGSIWWAVKHVANNIGTVFTIWDSVVSWNRWATEWFSNQYPTTTWRYAQLIPTNLSVSYSFMNSSQLQFFSKGIMPLFILYTLLLIFDLGLTKKKIGYFIGLVASQYLLQRFLSPYIGSAYVDAPLAFFTMITIAPLLDSKEVEDENQKFHYMVLGSIFSAGAALTKQNGLLVFVMYPILAYMIILKDMNTLPWKEKLRRLVIVFVLTGVLLLPWYLFNEIRILQGAKTNVDFLMSSQLHQGRTPIQRFLRAIRVMGIYVYLYPFVILSLPFMKKEFRWVVAALLIPYSLIWGFLFSLETRNLSIALPLLGLATGLGAGGLTEWTAGLLSKIKISSIKTAVVLLLAAAVFLGASLSVPTQPLVDKQLELQRDALIKKINHYLYDYFAQHGGYEEIFTNYPLKYIPELAEYQIEIGAFVDYETYTNTLEAHPDVRYMLVQTWRIDDQIEEEIMSRIENQTYQVIFESNNYTFIKMLDR